MNIPNNLLKEDIKHWENFSKAHSEGVVNYIYSLIEIGDPIDEQEFKQTYKRLSTTTKGKNRNIRRAWNFHIIKCGWIKEK